MVLVIFRQGGGVTRTKTEQVAIPFFSFGGGVSWVSDDGKYDSEIEARIDNDDDRFQKRKKESECEGKDCEGGALECAFVWIRNLDGEGRRDSQK